MNCTNKDKYISKGGRCCDRCAAGSYMRAECDGAKETECEKCSHGFYTATKNHLKKCQKCKECNDINQRKVKDCTAKENTVCECVTGFHCSNEQCDHCQMVKVCTLGEGVKVQATRTNDTICAPCEKGTYSNVTDFHSPCQTHTRCEDIGRVVLTPGTRTTDAICGNFKSHCPWILPAALWSGLALTALIFLGLICWRAKRKSDRACVQSVTRVASVPVTLTETVPAAPVSLLELPLPSREQNGHCQESCVEDGCKLPLFSPDDHAVTGCTQGSADSSLSLTPLKASVSFADSSQTNGSAGYCAGNFHRTYSEPQEDEWCGT